MSTLRHQWASEIDPPTGRPPKDTPGGCFLDDLCVLSFEGSDAATFLQGYLTCDTQTLAPDRLQAWALCNLKGRVVANGWGYAAAADRIDLLVHVSLADLLQSFFKPYLMFAKTDLVSRADSVLVFGGLGERLPGALPIDEEQHVYLSTDLASAAAVYSPTADPAQWRLHLIESRRCLVSEPTSSAFLPQMLALDRSGAVSFDKGCYLGQEVVARAQHRGSVKRSLQRLRWTGHAPNPGDALQTAAGRNVGSVINAAAESAESGLALAVVGNETDYPLHRPDAVLTAHP